MRICDDPREGPETALPLVSTDDRFEEWLRMPVAQEGVDPRLELRRAALSEFDAIYDLVDGVFGCKRPRVRYDWLYRRNPRGRARCWVIAEKKSGRLVSSVAAWPWPVARGGEPLRGLLVGDWVVSPLWQGSRLTEPTTCAVSASRSRQGVTLFAWVNSRSSRALTKSGFGARLIGRLTRGVLLLDGTAYWESRGWPKAAARLLGAADVPGKALRRLVLGQDDVSAVEQVRRFDSSFNTATERCMAWRDFWCPHDAEFLNWRYFDHPETEHIAFAARVGEEPAGYCVIRLDGQRPHLMEFAAPETPRHVGPSLLRRAIAAAREAGCARLDFFAPSGWRHWRLFRSAGFITVKRLANVSMYATGPHVPDVRRLANWQVVPGDHDAM